MKKIAILNYGVGNVRSVANALRTRNAEGIITSVDSEVMSCDGLIIPGVGAFKQGMLHLNEGDLVSQIRKYVATNRPVLGICLGMQMLFESSTEFGKTQGLGLIPGIVDRIPTDGSALRLPHIAWSNILWQSPANTAFSENIDKSRARFYFVHSYAATQVPREFIAGTVKYGHLELVAAVRRDNVWGTQFHPEKSGPHGLQVLENFISSC